MENIITPNAMVYLSAALCTIPMAASAWGVAKLWITMIEPSDVTLRLRKTLIHTAGQGLPQLKQSLCTVWLLP